MRRRKQSASSPAPRRVVSKKSSVQWSPLDLPRWNLEKWSSYKKDFSCLGDKRQLCLFPSPHLTKKHSNEHAPSNQERSARLWIPSFMREQLSVESRSSYLLRRFSFLLSMRYWLTPRNRQKRQLRKEKKTVRKRKRQGAPWRKQKKPS